MRNFNNKLVKKMAALALAAAGIGIAAAPAFAQDAAPQEIQAPAPTYQPRTAEDLQQLAGPFALYPDALLAQVFVAATYPNDVVAAAQYLQNGGDPNQAGGFDWDASVKGLLQTPDALNELAGNVDAMNQLGDAFLNQQQDVMNAVQFLRAQAQNNGNLCTTPEQEVVTADHCIQIIPANPQFICVPTYDPAIVYFRRVGYPCITFGRAVRVGLWLGDDCDWYDHRIYTGSWGFERPWWHVGGGFSYVHSHPGVYVNVNARSRSTAWVRQGFSPRPVHLNGAVASHVVRTNFRVPEIPVRGPHANGIGLGANRAITTARVTGHTATTARGTSTISHGNGTVSSHTVTRSTTHTTGVANHRTATTSTRSVSTSHHEAPARVTTRSVTTSHVTSHATASSSRPRQVASASSGHAASNARHR